ncbi:MAG: proprotein convertase P-domain-containing protein, partial [Saprospiraceae bacterium]
MKKINIKFFSLLSTFALVAFASFQMSGQCVLTAPATVTVNADPGTCEAVIPTGTLTANATNCASIVTEFSENFDALVGNTLPAGWGVDDGTTDGGGTVTGTTSDGATLGCGIYTAPGNTGAAQPIGTFPNASGNWVNISDDAAVDAAGCLDLLGNGCVLSPVIDLTTLGLSGHTLQYDFQVDNLGSTFTVDVWDGSAWVNVQTETGDATGLVSIDISAYDGNTDFQVRYCYDDGGNFAWGAGFDNFLIEAPDPTTSVVTNDSPLAASTSSSDGDAAGTYPVGTYTITYSAADPAGGFSTATTTLNVVDAEAPTLACPGDMTIHLDPGACDQVLSYDVTATDNCPLVGAPVTFTMNNSFNLADVTTGLNCGNGNSISYLQVYDLPALGATSDLEATSIDIILSGNTPDDVIANIYSIPTLPGAGVNFNYADLTLLGTNTFNYTPTFFFNTPTLATIPVAASIPAGTIVVLEIVSPNDNVIVSVNSQGMFTGGDSYVAGCIGAFANPTSIDNTVLAGLGQYAMQLNATLPAVPLQTAGLGIGEAFPIGTTTNTWEITDGAGNVATCSWSVTVVEFVPTSNDITCNSLVHISLDENCEATVGADQILEGNNYGCYDNFDVVFAGSGLPLVLDGSHVGQTIEVMVTNPAGIPCWGYILVEDKLIPELECTDIEVTCADPTTPGSLFGSRIDYAFPQFGTQDFTVVSETVSVDAGTTVQDLDVTVSSSHTWVGDLVITVTSPSGTSVELMNNIGGPGFGCAGTGLEVVFDDAADLTYDDLDGTCNNLPAAEGTFQPIEALSAFNGENAQGTWTVSVEDLAGPDQGNMNITLNLKAANSGTIAFPVPAGVTVIPAGTNTWTLLNFDPCGPATLTSSDVESGELCSGDAQIERTWTVTDGSGNTTSCTEIISIIPTTLTDIAASLPTD